MQGVETRPDEQVQQNENDQLIETADEALLRQTPQEQELETARKITEQARAEAVPRLARGGWRGQRV